MKYFNLQDRVAIITGGAQGLGKETAKLIASMGATVVSGDVSAKKNRKVAETLRKKTGGEVHPITVDVSNPESCNELVDETVNKFGGLDILINNASVRDLVDAKDVSNETWQKHVDVNLSGTFYCCRAALPHLETSDNGRIVNITSLAVRRGHSTGAAPYTASKAGVLGLTRTLASELGEETLTINAISPASMRGSGMLEDFSEETIEEITNQFPTNTIPNVDEVAFFVMVLCSPFARAINGQSFEINSAGYMP